MKNVTEKDDLKSLALELQFYKSSKIRETNDELSKLKSLFNSNINASKMTNLYVSSDIENSEKDNDSFLVESSEISSILDFEIVNFIRKVIKQTFGYSKV